VCAVFLTVLCSVVVMRGADVGASSAPNLADLPLDQLLDMRVENVTGASRYEQKVTQAPASVSIVTADEIQKFGYRTLTDVLRGVRGLYVSDDRNYAYVGIRGFLRPGDYNTRILVLVDGHRMNDNVYDYVDVGRATLVDVDAIDRVEVIRGPSSSIYGSSAFFGVINIVTKTGAQVNGTEFSVSGGTLDSFEGRFNAGKKFSNGLDWLFSGSYYTSQGHEHLYYREFDQRVSSDPRATNNGVARNIDSESAAKFFSSAHYHDLTLSGFISYRYKQVPTAAFGTLFNDDRQETDDYRAYADLKLERDIAEDVRLLARMFYDNYQYYGDSPYNYAAPGDPANNVLFRESGRGEWVGSELQLTGKLFDRHRLSVGAEYRENLRQELISYDVKPPLLSPRGPHQPDAGRVCAG
jgi:outer membrane receptor for ferrienterochelin and colicins